MELNSGKRIFSRAIGLFTVLVLAGVVWKGSSNVISLQRHSAAPSTLRFHSQEQSGDLPWQKLSKEVQSERVKSVVEQARLLKESLVSKYGAEHKDIFSSMTIPSESREIIKAKFLRRVIEQSTFSMVFSGTSVTAGHDNFFSNAYPQKLRENLAPLFELLGISLNVLDQAAGNNPIFPYHLCMHTIAGENVDILGWEQQMMCAGGQADCIEHFTRQAFTLAGKPAVIVLDAVPDVGLLKYAPSIDRRFFNSVGSSKNLHEKYQSFGIHSFLALHALENKKGIDQFSTEHLMKDGKPFEHKSWHPGPYGHQFIADILAYNYADIFSSALNDFSEVDDVSNILAKADLHGQSLPDPVYFSLSGYELNPGTSCATSYEPKANADFELTRFVKSDNVIIARDPLNKTLDPLTKGKWHLQLWVKDIDAVKRVLSRNIGNIDRKWVLMGDKDSGDLVFKFTTTYDPAQENDKASNSPMLCNAKKGFSAYPSGYFQLDAGSSFVKLFLDGKEISQSQIISSVLGPCWSIGEEHLPPGDHELVVRVTEPTGQRLALSHLIWK